MKVEKVYLLNPPCYNQKDRLVREGRCMQRESSWSNLLMPLTLCLLKSCLQKNLGVTCKLRDAVADRFTIDDVTKEILAFDPDVVVINTAVPTIMNEELDMAKRIKETKQETFVIMFGIPATSMTQYIFADPRGNYVDACAHHECEVVIEHLLATLKQNGDWKQCKGIAYGKDGKVVYNESPPPLDLNKLPPADFSDLNLDEYTVPFSRKRVVLIETSRGCPGKCIFCNAPGYYSNCFRFKDPELIVDEMEDCINQYNVKTFLFWADTWMMGGKKAEQICDSIVKRGLDIEFICNGRVNTSYLELLQKMKKAGCLTVAYGVESAVQEILNRNKKGITVEQIETAIRNANKVGVSSTAHVIVGLPGETKETAKLTTERLIKFNPTYLNAYCPVPYPGTELYEEAKRNNWIVTDDFSMYEVLHAVMRNADMTVEDMKQARRYMLQRFYFRPRVFAREIKRTIEEKSIKRAFYLGIDGARFMKGWVFSGKSA